MKQAREICIRNCYSHLVIPFARIHSEFLIEERLPISSGSLIKEMGFYIENRDKLTTAIREFTGFLCQASMRDISDTQHPCPQNASTAVARFDNIPFFIDSSGELKIGLIDLEHFSPTSYVSHSWESLITFFSYHFDEIIDEARKFHLDLNLDYKRYESTRDAAIMTYEYLYTGHQNFLAKNGIQQANGDSLPLISEQRKNIFEKSFIGIMHEWYNYDAERDYFNYHYRDLTSFETAEAESMVH